jgi:enamine deaminase RidA (YjgF/YER057c/UK114 family)
MLPFFLALYYLECQIFKKFKKFFQVSKIFLGNFSNFFLYAGMNPDQKFQELKIVPISDTTSPSLANYLSTKVEEGMIFTAGHLPLVDGNLSLVGRLGMEISIADGQAQAKLACWNALASIRNQMGSLDLVTSILKLTVFVASVPEFSEHHLVANGASDLLVAIFGENGRHVRSSLGVSSLPLEACVEVELIARIKP